MPKTQYSQTFRKEWLQDEELKDIQRVNNSFNFNKPDPIIKSLVHRIFLPTAKVDPLDGNINEFLDPKIFLGYLFEKEVEVL